MNSMKESTKEFLAAPRVHLNGTSQDELLDQLCRACDAVRAAEAALCSAAPNARDYYVQEADSFRIAQNQHFERLNKLRIVREELEHIAEKVSDQR